MVGQLEGDTDALVVVRPPRERVPPPHGRLTAVSAEQADEEFLRRGLPGAAGAEEAEDLATTDGEVHAAHRGFG